MGPDPGPAKRMLRERFDWLLPCERMAGEPDVSIHRELKNGLQGALTAPQAIGTVCASSETAAPEGGDEEVQVKVRLSAAARRRWRLPADPFEVRGSADVWLGERWRYAAEAMADAAETGGFLALVGESGSGKSTLRRYVIDRMRREARPVRVVEPAAIDRTRLTAAAICDAIIADLSQERPRSSLEWRTRQARRILADSSRAGQSHVMIVEEAHDLHPSSLRWLKRIWEMEDGFQRLIAIVLIAQPEILSTLDARSWALREVVRRVEVLELGALDGAAEVGAFLAARIGDAVAPDGAEAIAARLRRRTRAGRSVNGAWPLAVCNLTAAAMNFAAELEQSQVTADTIAAVGEGQ